MPTTEDTIDTEHRSALTPPESPHKFDHALAAFNAQKVADYSAAWRDGRLQSAAGVLAKRPNATRDGQLSTDSRNELLRYLDEADRNDDRVQRYTQVRDQHLAVKVRSEPRMYNAGSVHSFYEDHMRAAVPGMVGYHEAKERLDRHSREVAVEVMEGRSAEGRRALSIASTRSRHRPDEAVIAERRAMGTGVSSGGAFVTPQYVVDDYALFNSYPASFLGQTSKIKDAGFGMMMFLPAFTSSPTVALQTETSGVSDSSPTAGYLTSTLSTFAGEVTLAEQLFQRAGPVGIDTVIHAALQQQLDTAINSYVIATALANAGTVAGAATFSATGLYGDLAKAKAQMLTAAGTKLQASHLFLQPAFSEWLFGQADANGRPLLLPVNNAADLPIRRAANGAAAPGFTGDRLAGTAVFTDGSLPNVSGSNSPLVLAAPSEVFVLQSEPVVRSIPQPTDSTLSVIVQLYGLCGAIPRHPLAVQSVSSAAYLAAPTYL